MEQLNGLQQLRYDLLKESNYSVEDAKKAFDFIFDGTPSIESTPKQKAIIENVQGIFILYEDGHAELFNGKNSKTGAANVAVKYGDLNVKLWKEDYINISMNTPRENKSLYLEKYDKAVEDFTGQKTTQTLLYLGLNIDLPEGTYIPSAGELYLIFALKHKLNAALTHIGHDPFENDWYWSCSVCAPTLTWGVYFGSVPLGSYRKTYEYRVRPVFIFQ